MIWARITVLLNPNIVSCLILFLLLFSHSNDEINLTHIMIITIIAHVDRRPNHQLYNQY